ncbi:efflux RND transporter permease subunit [Halodesulfovibrio sp.]|jgi:multidrug efflux pump subunit AcrB|uniref:efflux RND transporter permease subunit n=1 Tax=Halodesulfovibrio sp. TaxID=1912772 RepID=UPI0025F276D3|nr:efflux RND transporter permease subunit [Halodesulfovibrio sp.]MCT4534079.1 efflux RND transporter permease subunit [Halodesulfovibrio sp.]
MNLAELSIKKRAITQFVVLLLFIAGAYSYFQMGKLEDPEFTLKTAIVITQYPGASTVQVEEEVTDVLETAIQQMESLKHVRSMSRPGLSVVWVDIQESKRARELPQIWDDLRKKMRDVTPTLPPGVRAPMVKDDFGDVYGVFLTVTSDGFSYAELKKQVDELRKELLLVKNVAKVEIWGAQRECIYVDMSSTSLAERGIPPASVFNALDKQNVVIDSGNINIGRERLRLAVNGEFNSVEAVGNLIISRGASDKMVLLRDIATIRKGYVEPVSKQMRFNGMPSLGIAASTVSGGNVIKMGEAVKARINELKQFLPIGMEISVVAMQSDLVQKSIDEFMMNLGAALLIVVALLFIFMGVRSGMLIGLGLLLTIATTFLVMRMLHVDLQRISLGALIIALGMLVDNAIVVTESMLIKLQLGKSRLDAAKETYSETAWPLLGATIVAALAFLPVYLADNNTGEFCESLFVVVGVSLLVSWLLAMTVSALWCYIGLKVPENLQGKDPYAGIFFTVYRKMLDFSIRFRWVTLATMVVLLFLAVTNFKYVDKTFFPESRRPQLIVDYWLPEGTNVDIVSEDLYALEKSLLQFPTIADVASFVGGGGTRFYLSLEPEFANSSYGQLILNINDAERLDETIEFIQKELDEKFLYAEPRVRKFPLGAAAKFKVEARFRGPDRKVLHDLAEQAKAIMLAEPTTKYVRDDWRQPVKVIEAEYSQARGLRVGVTRADVAQALKRGYDGITMGVYREENKLLPIIMRPPATERRRVEDMQMLQVYNKMSPQGIPMGQLVSDVKTTWEESTVRRRDHQRAITVQCDPRVGTAETLRRKLQPAIEALTLPPGYTLEWGGSWEKSNESRSYVGKGLPVTFLLMALVVVMLFNAYRQPLIIACVIPLSIIGVTSGLLLTRQPFGFLALLGFLSLSGMLIKNAVILIDQIDAEIAAGKEPYAAVLDSSVSRIRPVLMAAMSTVLGMLPLVIDRFWASMAVTICFGLTFATVLTLIVVPVLYTLFFRITRTVKS